MKGRRNRYPQKDFKRLYEIYHGIKKRCYNKNCKRYKDYGGRGIYMCNEWLSGGVDSFIDWALTNGYEDNLTIDRIDNNGIYEPSNCRWVTYKENCRNKRKTLYVEYKGIRKPLRTWCEELNLNYDNMHDRIYCRGMSVDDAFQTGKMKGDFAAMCRKHGMKDITVYNRIHKLGWSLEEALNTPNMGLGTNQFTIKKVQSC